MFYWFLKWVALGPLLRLVFRPHVEGSEHVPDEGPAILASNHLSYADWLFMPLTLSRRVTFVAKAEYFDNPDLQGPPKLRRPASSERTENLSPRSASRESAQRQPGCARTTLLAAPILCLAAIAT